MKIWSFHNGWKINHHKKRKMKLINETQEWTGINGVEGCFSTGGSLACLPGWCSGQESACRFSRPKRLRFESWFGKIPWIGKWQLTPVFLPGKPQGQRSLAGLQPMKLQRLGQDWVSEHTRSFGNGLGRSPGEGIGYSLQYSWAFLEAQSVNNPPAMRETWVPSLGREDSLDWEMAAHSSILAWRILWTEEPGGLQSMGSRRVRQNWVTFTFRQN